MVFQSPGGFEATTKAISISAPVSWIAILQGALSTASVSLRENDHYGFSCQQEIAQHSGITNGTQVDSSHTVSFPQRFKTALMCNSKEERMKKWSNTIGIRPIRISIRVTPPQVTLPAGGRPPGPPQREQSYIENILRLNIGEPGIFHFSFEHALESGVNTRNIAVQWKPPVAIT